MYTLLNNILLGIFIILCLCEGDFAKKKGALQLNFKWAIPIIAFFFLALMASMVNYSGHFFKHIEKYWSFLLLPLVFFSQENFYFKYKELIFKGLLTGCIATLLICYLNVFYEIYTKDQPLYYFFTWGHLNLRFTDVADTHPAYLGLFLVTSTLYLF